MPLFVCDDCGCVDNTAGARYWTRDYKDMWAEDNFGKALCTACAPTKFVSGEPTNYNGKWTSGFKREKLSKEGLEKGWYINREPK